MEAPGKNPEIYETKNPGTHIVMHSYDIGLLFLSSIIPTVSGVSFGDSCLFFSLGLLVFSDVWCMFILGGAFTYLFEATPFGKHNFCSLKFWKGFKLYIVFFLVQ